MARVALNQPFEAMEEADDVATTQNTPDRGCPDYAVNAGSSGALRTDCIGDGLPTRPE